MNTLKSIILLSLLLLCLPCFSQKNLIDISKTDGIKQYTYPVRENSDEVIYLIVQNYSSEIPLELSAYKSLQILVIENCDLSRIYVDFNNYPHLQSLNIINTKFDTLVFNGQGEYLKEISLYGYHFANYDFIAELHNIEKFYILDSATMNIENLTYNLLKLKKLNFIYFADCGITQLPESFSQLTSLNEIYFHGMDTTFDIASLFQRIQHMELNSLYLMFCKSKSLPHNINLLKKVKDLYIRSSNFISLPSEIGELTQLERLLASECPIDSIPDSIVGLKNLKELELMCNFKSFPVILYQMTWLKELAIGSMEWFPTEDELRPIRKLLKNCKVNEFGF